MLRFISNFLILCMPCMLVSKKINLYNKSAICFANDKEKNTDLTQPWLLIMIAWILWAASNSWYLLVFSAWPQKYVLSFIWRGASFIVGGDVQWAVADSIFELVLWSVRGFYILFFWTKTYN